MHADAASILDWYFHIHPLSSGKEQHIATVKIQVRETSNGRTAITRL